MHDSTPQAPVGYPARLRRIAGIVGGFIAGQGLLQAVQLTVGFILIRFMAVDQYGQYAFVIGAQAMGSVLSDMGCRSAIIALVAGRCDDKNLLGTYIKAGLYYRYLLGVLACVVTTVFLLVLISLHGQSTAEFILFSVLIAFVIFLDGSSQYFSLPLLMQHRMAALYRPQVTVAVMRGALIVTAAAAGHLDAISATAITAAASCVLAIWMHQTTRNDYVLPPHVPTDIYKDIRNYIVPLIPATLLSAFQDQIIILMLTIFGQVKNIAEASALGRLAQLFQLLNAANSNLISPWFARQNRQSLLSSYWKAFFIAIGIAVAICFSVTLVPQLFLWILGPNYQHLVLEVKLSIYAASVGYIQAVMWAMNSARRWVYPWSGVLFVISVVCTQIGCILLLDLSLTRNAIIMSLAVACAGLAVQILHSAIGFLFSEKRPAQTEVAKP